MDWPSPNSGLSDDDLSKVFRYLPQETTVVRRLTTDSVSDHHSTSPNALIDLQVGACSMVSYKLEGLG